MIYISFSTVPDRMSEQDIYIKFLNSLLVQNTTEPYKIILNIPLKYKNYDSAEIPGWLTEFIQEHSDKFIVLRDEIDYGPIVNLLYPVKHLSLNPDDIIIVCDDDHVYHPDMISYHLKMLEKYPENHCICFRGNRPMEMRSWEVNGTVWARLYQTHVYFPTRYDIYLQFPDHWHSVSYRRKFLQDDILDESFWSMTWNNDILMAYYAWTHNFYYMCPVYDKETDWRPVNDDGRGANSFPVVEMLPIDGNGGCAKYRTDSSQNADIWKNKIFTESMHEKPPFVVNFTKSEQPTIEKFQVRGDNESVIVTLSTVPQRLLGKSGDEFGIQPGLRTILEQTNVLYEVHLNIPYAYQYQKIHIPNWLVDWQEQYPHLKIFRTADFGPVTKIYPTLQRVLNPNQLIITVDDDLLYEDGFILAHLEARERYPECAIGFAGITSIEEHEVGRYHFASTTPEDIRVRLLEGYKTISYRRYFFTEEFDEFALSHWNDDVAISAYLGYKNIHKMVLKCPTCTNYSPRVESFPVINHVPLESNGVGCNRFRRDDAIIKSGDDVANEWYTLGYLEK